jgi:hypothetical protein
MVVVVNEVDTDVDDDEIDVTDDDELYCNAIWVPKWPVIITLTGFVHAKLSGL